MSLFDEWLALPHSGVRILAYIEVGLSNGIYIPDHTVELEAEVATASHSRAGSSIWALCEFTNRVQRMCADPK